MMKKTLIALLALVLAFPCGSVCFAAESGLAPESKTVFAEYVGDEQKTEVPVSDAEDGKITTEVSENIEVTVSNIPEGAVTLAIYYVPEDTESNAWNWIKSCFQGKGTPVHTFDVYFVNEDGTRIPANNTVITITCPGKFKNPIVCSLGTDGKIKELKTEVKTFDAKARAAEPESIFELTFTTNGSSYYVIAEKTEQQEDKKGSADSSRSEDQKNGSSSAVNGKDQTNEKKPGTGDSSFAGLWITLAAASAVCILGMVFLKKKRAKTSDRT